MQNLRGDPNVRNLHLYLHLCEYTSNTRIIEKFSFPQQFSLDARFY